jgi:hypothetical protein
MSQVHGEPFAMRKVQTGEWTGADDYRKAHAIFLAVIRHWERIGWVLRPDSMRVRLGKTTSDRWYMECILLSPKHADNARLRGERVDLK